MTKKLKTTLAAAGLGATTVAVGMLPVVSPPLGCTQDTLVCAILVWNGAHRVAKCICTFYNIFTEYRRFFSCVLLHTSPRFCMEAKASSFECRFPLGTRVPCNLSHCSSRFPVRCLVCARSHTHCALAGRVCPGRRGSRVR
jgi:hypothetical protein